MSSEQILHWGFRKIKLSNLDVVIYLVTVAVYCRCCVVFDEVVPLLIIA